MHYFMKQAAAAAAFALVSSFAISGAQAGANDYQFELVSKEFESWGAVGDYCAASA